MENKFENITFGDVNVTFEYSSINVSAPKYKRSIDFKNLDSAVYKEVYIPRITVMNLAVRSTILFFVLGCLTISLVGGDHWEGFLWVTIILWIAAFLSFRMIWGSYIFSIMFGANFWDKIIKKYFSNQNYQITIGNKNGEVINIYTLITDADKKKIEKLQNIIEKIRNMVFKESIQVKKVVVESNDYFKELSSLNELLKSGILTQEEFDLKKKQILGL